MHTNKQQPLELPVLRIAIRKRIKLHSFVRPLHITMCPFASMGVEHVSVCVCARVASFGAYLSISLAELELASRGRSEKFRFYSVSSHTHRAAQYLPSIRCVPRSALQSAWEVSPGRFFEN